MYINWHGTVSTFCGSWGLRPGPSLATHQLPQAGRGVSSVTWLLFLLERSLDKGETWNNGGTCLIQNHYTCWTWVLESKLTKIQSTSACHQMLSPYVWPKVHATAINCHARAMQPQTISPASPALMRTKFLQDLRCTWVAGGEALRFDQLFPSWQPIFHM